MNKIILFFTLVLFSFGCEKQNHFPEIDQLQFQVDTSTVIQLDSICIDTVDTLNYQLWNCEWQLNECRATEEALQGYLEDCYGDLIPCQNDLVLTCAWLEFYHYYYQLPVPVGTPCQFLWQDYQNGLIELPDIEPYNLLKEKFKR